MTSVDCDGVATFEFYRPDATDVLLLGTFNGWRGESLRMTSAGDGWWRVQAEMPPGEFRFRYLADVRDAGKQWFTDFAANGVENGKYGWNSILIIPEHRGRKIRVDGIEWNTANAASIAA